MDNNDLSPVSALRLNFDQLPAETTDPTTTTSVFGVPVAQFVPQSVISWLDGGKQNLADCIDGSPITPDQSQLFSTNESNDQSNIITKKVCFIVLLALFYCFIERF